MAPPLSFGAELEFTMAILVDEDETQNAPQTPILHFTPIQEDYDYQERNRAGMDEVTALKFIHTRAAKRHIRNTINNASINVSLNADVDHFSTNTTAWELVEDPSVEGRYGTQYLWLSLEIRSPAYWYTQDALAVIEKICKLLKDTYLVDTNRTCGLHVHVAQGEKAINFSTIRRLLAFAWAFEHQINTLHPLHRLENDYAQSARDTGRMAIKSIQKYGSRIAPLAGVSKILAIPDIKELADQCSEYRNVRQYKPSSYNIRGPVLLSRGVRDEKPTIEFRQHEGTLDGEAIVMWIKTVIGIVNFLYNVRSDALGKLLLKCQNETWEKLGDGEDAQRERNHGPILAERDFTIIHLLRYIGLDVPAAYYETKWHKHPKESDMQSIHIRELWIEWEYEIQPNASDPESDGYRSNDELRQLWDIMRVVHANNPDIFFIHDDQMWPAHTHLKEDWDRDTDYSTDPEVASPMKGSINEDSTDSTNSTDSSGSEPSPPAWRPIFADIAEVPEDEGNASQIDDSGDEWQLLSPLRSASSANNQDQEGDSDHSSRNMDSAPPLSVVRAPERFSMSAGSDTGSERGTNSSLWAVVSSVSSLYRQIDTAINEQRDTPTSSRELLEIPSDVLRREIKEGINDQLDTPNTQRELSDTPSDVAICQAVRDNEAILELSPQPLNITRRCTKSLSAPSNSLSEDERTLAELDKQIEKEDEVAWQQAWQQRVDATQVMRWSSLLGVVDPAEANDTFAACPGTLRRRRRYSSADMSPMTRNEDWGETPAFG